MIKQKNEEGEFMNRIICFILRLFAGGFVVSAFMTLATAIIAFINAAERKDKESLRCGVSSIIYTILLFGIGFIVFRKADHIEELWKNFADEYKECVDAGYTVYLDGTVIDGTKLKFDTIDYSIDFDDENQEIILQRK